jgi:hypothetical protein
MLRLRPALFVCFLLALAGTATAQSYSGTWSVPMGTGASLSLQLRQDAAGRVTGTLTGNTSFQVQAQVQNGQLTGYAIATGGRLYMVGQLQGEGLALALAEVGPDGQPQTATARTVMLTRARGRASSDPYVGTFSNGELTISLTRNAQGYAGSAAYQGAQYPLAAQLAGDRISGVYQANGQNAPFQAQVQGDAMVLATNDGTYQLQRAGAAGAAAGGMAMGGQGGMGGQGAMAGGGAMGAQGGGSPQDRQISQLLLRTAWCYFSYSQTSGTTRTERVVFRPDGSGAQSTGGETYSSGANGTVAGQSQGGQPFQWRVQGGNLLVSADGMQWDTQPLRITQNSSGSPIVTAGGKEYAVCN